MRSPGDCRPAMSTASARQVDYVHYIDRSTTSEVDHVGKSATSPTACRAHATVATGSRRLRVPRRAVPRPGAGGNLSSLMLSQSRKRNRTAVDAGRLHLLEGGVPALSDSKPADLVMANHVLYFWPDPVAELAQIRGYLRPGGLLALGYQLRENMPAMAQRRFPPAGHRLYDSDDEVTALATAAGFVSVEPVIKGTPTAPEGRVVLATA